MDGQTSQSKMTLNTSLYYKMPRSVILTMITIFSASDWVLIQLDLLLIRGDRRMTIWHFRNLRFYTGVMFDCELIITTYLWSWERAREHILLSHAGYEYSKVRSCDLYTSTTPLSPPSIKYCPSRLRVIACKYTHKHLKSVKQESILNHSHIFHTSFWLINSMQFWIYNKQQNIAKAL